MRNIILLSITFILLAILYMKKPFSINSFSHLNVFDAHISALVLARGGSKGIKLKNIAKLNNNTLLSRALKTIFQCGLFDSVWVSTDEGQIAEEAERHGAKIHWRQAYTATDDASSLTAVKEFIQNHPEVGVVALVQCTSPFLKVKYLIEAYYKLQQGFHSVFSVTRQHNLRWKLEGDSVVPDNFDMLSRPRRQDWEGEIIENGMFYFTFSELVLEHEILQGGRIGLVEIPSNESLEIDRKEDLKFAEVLLKISYDFTYD